MKNKLRQLPTFTARSALGLFLTSLLVSASFAKFQARSADTVEGEKLMAEARAKEAHAQQLRATAAAALQKASDDQMEASAEERDSRILAAKAMALLGSDPNKQRAFKLRVEARKLSSQANQHLISARNAEQKAAQLSHNSEELTKAAAQIKDQPAVATTLENEAKEQATEAQNETQAAGSAKLSAQSLEDRAKNFWAEAEKLDPQNHPAPAASKAVVAEPRQVK